MSLRRSMSSGLLAVLLGSLLVAACSSTGGEPHAAVDPELPRSRTGIVSLAPALADVRFASVDGTVLDCAAACDRGLRLPAGSHRLGLAVRGDGTPDRETRLELFIEARHRYELRRVDGADPARFGVLDLGESPR